jgi:hypothetical protein
MTFHGMLRTGIPCSRPQLGERITTVPVSASTSRALEAGPLIGYWILTLGGCWLERFAHRSCVLEPH